MTVKMLDGNAAAVEALVMAKVGVIAAYPITPQNSISEALSDRVASGELNAKYIRVESEHTAMSVTMSAQLAGTRSATATSSVGLALMHEIVGSVSGTRMPVVMPVVNRSLCSPWSLWCDHTDTMSERDQGWMQVYAENVQEVFDLILYSYTISEHPEVLTPTMVCLDGFFLSHSMQRVEIPEQSVVDNYVGKYVPTNLYINPEDPMFVNDLTPTSDYTEIKYQQVVGLERALELMPEKMDEFEKTFGRKLNIIEEYMTEDADVVLVTLGSMTGTAKFVVNKLRAEGKKVGVLKICVYRPFPAALVKKALEGKDTIGVLDRSAGLGGSAAPVCAEVRSAIMGNADVRGYVGGLAGRDIHEASIEKIFAELLAIKENHDLKHTSWIDLKDNPMEMREVMKIV